VIEILIEEVKTNLMLLGGATLGDLRDTLIRRRAAREA
jgi:isopentenyl diphosphate isomerase/L-lactate dehydrogenase-like FMN-dependent dehydrogenase